jgi:hypothetical protein
MTAFKVWPYSKGESGLAYGFVGAVTVMVAVVVSGMAPLSTVKWRVWGPSWVGLGVQVRVWVVGSKAAPAGRVVAE